MKEQMTRKEFLECLAVMGCLAGTSAILAACGQKEETEPGTGAGTKTASKPAAEDPCADLSGLTEGELKMRETLKYVAVSPEAGKRCDNCKFWQPPASEQGPCGSCTLIKGPIHPEGHCTSWFVREA